jgi:hypothetical protein
MTGNVTRLPVSRRLRVVRKASVQHLVNGVSMDLDALPAEPTAEQIQGFIERLTAIRNRILKGEE